MRDFEKRFNRTRRFVTIFIGAVFVLIIGWWVLVGVVGVSIAKNPEKVSEKVGEAAKAVKDGFNKGFYGDTTEMVEDHGFDKGFVVITSDGDTIKPKE